MAAGRERGERGVLGQRRGRGRRRTPRRRRRRTGAGRVGRGTPRGDGRRREGADEDEGTKPHEWSPGCFPSDNKGCKSSIGGATMSCQGSATIDQPEPGSGGSATCAQLPVSPTNNGIRIGAKLRAARKAHGYTLEQLALSAGLTKGFLSRVERDETSLSVASLITLCEVMSLDVGSLFAVPEVALVRRGTAPDDRPRRHRRERAPDDATGPAPAAGRCTRPRSQAAAAGTELYTISCELEVLYVLKGSVDLVLIDRRQRLTAGDALTFAGGEPHTLGQRQLDPAGRDGLGAGAGPLERQRLKLSARPSPPARGTRRRGGPTGPCCP